MKLVSCFRWTLGNLTDAGGNLNRESRHGETKKITQWKILWILITSLLLPSYYIYTVGLCLWVTETKQGWDHTWRQISLSYNAIPLGTQFFNCYVSDTSEMQSKLFKTEINRFSKSRLGKTHVGINSQSSALNGTLLPDMEPASHLVRPL